MEKHTQAIILGLMCFILTIGISVQIRTVSKNGIEISTNQEINNLKAQVLKMKEKYEISYEKLEKSQEELEQTRKRVTNNDQELKELEEEIKKYNIILGGSDVNGQGVIITVADAVIPSNTTILWDTADSIVHDIDILSIVNELKNAGAEAIDVNGQRIVANTAISCDGNVILINGEKISSPFTINAIGLPERLATLTRLDGYLDRMERAYIKTTFKKTDKVDIPKYIGTTNFKYAKTVK